MRHNAVFYLNGKRVDVGAEHAQMMLADYLRYQRGLTGTKIVCAEGDCGACTVLRSFAGFAGLQRESEFLPVNACITTVAQMDGSSLVTVDALAVEDKLTPVQTAMMTCHGSQCGFCTPGFVMALTGLVEKKKCAKVAAISERDARNALTGNLCRCTGYQPILEAATAIKPLEVVSVKSRFSSKSQVRELQEVTSEMLAIKGKDFQFYAPTSLKQAAQLLKKMPALRIVAAATDAGVSHNKWRERLTHVLSLHLIPELYELKSVRRKGEPARLSVGARVTLSELRSKTEDLLPELARFLDIFASPQIKNLATLIGNVANASPIADTPPFLLVADAVVEVMSAGGKRSIPIEKFFLAYRKTALKRGEFITSISFAVPGKNEVLALRKVSERKDLDISAVNAAIYLDWGNGDKNRIERVRIAIGGVAATTLRLKKAEAILRGQVLNADVLDRAVEAIHGEIAPIADVRGSGAFRHVLVENAVRRFFAEAQR